MNRGVRAGATRKSALSIGTDGWIALPGSWTYVSGSNTNTLVFATPPDVTQLLSVGWRVKVNQGGTIRNCIVVLATPTQVTLLVQANQVGVSLANATDISVSPTRFPAGFSPDRVQWTIEFFSIVSPSQASPVMDTWYNLASATIAVPPGAWDLGYECGIEPIGTSTTTSPLQRVGIATSTASDGSTVDFKSVATVATNSKATAATFEVGFCTRRKLVTLAAAQAYFLMHSTDHASMTSLNILGGVYGQWFLNAISTYF